MPGEEVADRYLAWLWHRVRQQAGAIFVAEEGAVFQGFLACWIVREDHIIETPDPNRFGFISDICVLREARGRGIAHWLLTAAEQHLGARGVARLRLGALAGNTAAQSAYAKFGFAPYEIVFEKRLGC